MGDGLGYDGFCSVCGAAGTFDQQRDDGRIGRDFCCSSCGSAAVFQAEASVLLDEYSTGRHASLDALLRSPKVTELDVYYVGRTGPVRDRLRKHTKYRESVWVPDVALGSRSGPRFRTVQDHGALTFEDESFDLVMSSHVLEHVPEPAVALREAHRVLRPGGRYIFSVPAKWPLPERSIVRATLGEDGPVHHLPEAYHRSPEGEPALVFTDFGADLVETLAGAGLVGSLRRPFRSHRLLHRLYVVVATRPGPVEVPSPPTATRSRLRRR